MLGDPDHVQRLALAACLLVLVLLLLFGQPLAANLLALAIGFAITLIFLAVVVYQVNIYLKHCADEEDVRRGDYKRCCEEGTRQIWENFGLLLRHALRVGTAFDADG